MSGSVPRRASGVGGLVSCARGLVGSGWLVLACSTGIEVGSMRARAQVGTGLDAGTDAAPGCTIVPCKGRILQCGDCLDNDGDGRVDSFDGECLGACDNTEDSLYGGITADLESSPGANNAPCVMDCYFDQDTGGGNDACAWSHGCDPLSVEPGYPPSGLSKCAYDPGTSVSGTKDSCEQLFVQQPQTCLDACLPLTPNGCDCFGCCELPAGTGRYVWLGSTQDNLGSCTLTAAADPDRCRPCTPTPSCFNPCAPGEACVGRAPQDVSCDAGEGRCAAGVQPCGREGDAPCSGTSYCITGCCMDVPW